MPAVTLNGRPAHLAAIVPYERLVRRAGMRGTVGGPRPAVSYRAPSGASGTLAPGDEHAVEQGTVFNVAHTDSA